MTGGDPLDPRDPQDPLEPHEPGDRDSKDDAALLALVRRGAGTPPRPPKGLLQRVQRTIRRRSRGKFFNDGWSTSPLGAHSSLLALMALALLLIFTLAYFALGLRGP